MLDIKSGLTTASSPSLISVHLVELLLGYLPAPISVGQLEGLLELGLLGVAHAVAVLQGLLLSRRRRGRHPPLGEVSGSNLALRFGDKSLGSS